MRVLCTNSEAWPDDYPKEDNNGKITNGDSYIVTDVFFEDGYIWYELSIDPDFGYWENCFSRTSDIDETELIKERQSELV